MASADTLTTADAPDAPDAPDASSGPKLLKHVAAVAVLPPSQACKLASDASDSKPPDLVRGADDREVGVASNADGECGGGGGGARDCPREGRGRAFHPPPPLPRCARTDGTDVTTYIYVYVGIYIYIHINVTTYIYIQIYILPRCGRSDASDRYVGYAPRGDQERERARKENEETERAS